MTGEITLRGRVLPIGGLKSKILAAHLSGAKMIILPRKNEKDLRDIPEEIRKQIKLVLVDNMEQVLDAALRAKPMPLSTEPVKPRVVARSPRLRPAPKAGSAPDSRSTRAISRLRWRSRSDARRTFHRVANRCVVAGGNAGLRAWRPIE